MKKKKIIIILLLVLFVLITISAYFIYGSFKIKNIKNHYNEIVLVNKNTSLYDKNKNKIGKINKGFTLSLDKKTNFKKKDIYFKIKDTSYYIYYKDVDKTKELVVDSLNSNYVSLNKRISIEKPNFYLNDKLQLSLNDKLEFDILYKDNNYYYVKILNRILGIKIKDAKEISDNNLEIPPLSNYISVIYYNKIDNCNSSECVNLDQVKEELNYLKENGFYTITIDEYNNWKNGFINLKEKAILLTTNEDNENVDALEKEYSVNIEILNEDIPFKFLDDNKATKRESDINSLSRYIIQSKTTLDKFEQITRGEDVIYEVPKVNINQTHATYNNQGIAVINYHFFYDEPGGERCNENICLDVHNFREQLNYLRDNNFKTLTMEEFTKWMYGEIELPQKSVLLTVDDGAQGTGKHNGNKLIPILEEYNMHATLFLITGWWDVNNYKSPNLDIQSHTNDMHNYGSCGKGQVVCSSKEELLNDLNKSLQIVDNNNSFCFPFYSYSDLAVETVKEAGFKMAFVGGNRKATRNNNKFLIPRYPIYKTTTLQQFINMVN